MYIIKLPLNEKYSMLQLAILARKFETRNQAEQYAKAMQIEQPIIRKVG